ISFFFSSRRRHTSFSRDWSSDVCSSDLVEISVLWFTEGKGDEDLAVHYFERLTADDVPELNLKELRRFQTILPQSPLSYEGVLEIGRASCRERMYDGMSG